MIMNKYIFAISKNLTLMCGNFEFDDNSDELCYQLDSDVIERSSEFLRQIPEEYHESIKSNYRDSFVQRNYEFINVLLRFMSLSHRQSRSIFYSFLRLLRRSLLTTLVEKLQADKNLYQHITCGC